MPIGQLTITDFDRIEPPHGGDTHNLFRSQKVADRPDEIPDTSERIPCYLTREFLRLTPEFPSFSGLLRSDLTGKLAKIPCFHDQGLLRPVRAGLLAQPMN